MKIHHYKSFILAELYHAVHSFHDIIDQIGSLHYSEDSRPLYVAIHLEALPKDFLDLRNKQAGELFQKFVTYNIKVSIIGKIISNSRSLNDLIRESNRSNLINFHPNLDDYIEKIKTWQ